MAPVITTIAISVCLAASTTPAPQPSSPHSITLRDAIRLAVESNLDLLSKRLELRRARAQETAAWQSYMPELGIGAEVSDLHSPIAAKTGRYAESSVGLGWTSPVGTRVGADLALVRSVDTDANDGALVLSINQPLLKGAWWAGAAQPLTETSLLAQIERETLRAETDAFIVDVQRAYWELALAQSEIEIKTRSRDRARQQHADTAENIKRGILAEAEIYLVEENLVFFEGELARVENQRNVARRRLANLLWLEPDAPLVAAQGLEQSGATDAVHDAAASLSTANEHSPQLSEQRLRADLARARERNAAMNGLPRLDVGGSIAVGGRGDLSHPALGALFSPDAQPDARVGITLSVPLGPQPVHASVEVAHTDVERAKLELAARELKLRHDIENAVADLTLVTRLEQLGRKQLELADLKLQAQQDKYKNGISTLADVVRFQRELDDASIALRRRVRDVHISRAVLMQREGRLSAHNGVTVQ